MKKIIIFLFLILIGCQQHSYNPKSTEGTEVLALVEHYYTNLENPHGISKSLSNMELNEKELGVTSIGDYLRKRGYKVSLLNQPRFISYDEPYAIYEVSIKVNYPQDFKKFSKEETINETVYVNVGEREINKVVTKDVFIGSRAVNYEIK